jgi:hypothetical protein
VAVELDELAGPTGGEKGRRLAQFWKDQIDKIKDDGRHKRWFKRGQTIEKRYRDERNRTDEEGQRHYNSLWMNTEIIFPALYGKPPVPIAERRFRDKDPTGRGAAQILERALRNEIEVCGFDEAMQNAVRDYLLPGRGTVWVRYEPEIEEGVSVVTEGRIDIHDAQGDIETGEDVDENPTPSGQIDTGEDDSGPDESEGGEGAEEPSDDDKQEETVKLEETGDRITRESCPVDFINWEDFITFPQNARTWKEVTAVGKRVYMTRDQMTERFGKIVGRYIPLRKDDRGVGRYDGPDQDPEDKGEVYEIWSLSDKEVVWVAEGYEFLCDRKDDPLNLENFFPCPRPLYANPTTGTLVPVPDYLEYQDQAIQIDELTQRISMLAKACKVAGVYNAAANSIQRLLNESVENELIPVDDWAAFAEGGGVAGNISFIPLKEIMGVLQELMQVKDKAILEMDRLTGITDIMRGTTDARETLGGQRLKTNSAGTRLQRRQNEVARFARDTVRIIADIMAQHFSPLSLIQASGALYEEGLGADDMPQLSAFQNMEQQPPQGLLPPSPSPAGAVASGPGPQSPPSGPGPTPLQGAPGAPGSASPTPGMPPSMPGAPPQQSNVVPFPGQGGPPPIPPQILAKFQALQRIADAIKLIRDERLRGFRVDIEVDSTIYSDMAQDKADRNEFLMTVTKYLEQALMMSQQVPEITPLLGKFLQFGVRGYKVGRDLESSIEEFCDEAVGIAQKKAAQAQQQPNPAMLTGQAQLMKGKAAMLTASSKAQNDQMKMKTDVQESQAKIAADQQKDQAEVQRQQLENQGDQANSQADLAMKNMDVRMREMELQMERMRMWTESIKATNAINKPEPAEGAA